MGNFWRTPNSHEMELIAAWAQKEEKAARPVEYFSVGFLTIFALVVSFFIYRGAFSLRNALFLGLLWTAILTILLLDSLHGSYRKRQITRGDYQLRDSVVRSKQKIGGSGKGTIFYVRVKISGEDRNVSVSPVVYNAVFKNTRGFLLRYGKKALKQNRKIQAFYPALRTDDCTGG